MTEEKTKAFISVKSVSWFIIASAVCIAYYISIDLGLMKAQGLDFMYLWNASK